MSKLLDDLRQGGRLEAEGEFRLDPEKAREKLRDFRLPDPHRWVLEIVSAANLLGAKRLDFRIDADEVEATFDGAPFSREDLDNFFAAAFRKVRNNRDIAAKQLAIGLTASEALRPAKLVVESNGCRLTLAPGKPTVEDIPASQTTRVYFRETFRASHLIDFFRNIGGVVAEKVYLRKHAEHSRTSVVLDGQVISKGAHLGGAQIHARLDRNELGGILSVVEGQNVFHLKLVQYGVLIEERVNKSHVGMLGLFDVPSLKRDMSNASFVDDDAFKRVMGRIDEGRYEALCQYFLNLPLETWYTQRALLDLCVSVVEDIADLRLKNREVSPWLAKLGWILEQAVIWPMADRPDETADAMIGPRNFTSLRRVRQSGKVYHAASAFPQERLVKKAPVLLLTKRHCNELTVAEVAAYLEFDSEDVTDELQRAGKVARNRASWQSQPWPTELNPHQQAALRTENVGEFRVSVGIAHAKSGFAAATWVKDGHFLCRNTVTNQAPFDVLISGPVHENAEFDGPQFNDHNRSLAFQAVRQFHQLFADIATRSTGEPDAQIRRAFRTYVVQLARMEFHAELLAMLAFRAQAAEFWLRHALPNSPYALGDFRNMGVSLDSVLDHFGAPADLKAFERVDGKGSHTLRELHRAAGGEGLFVVHERDRDRLFTIAARIPEGVFIWVDDGLERALHALYDRQVKPGIDRISTQSWLENYLARPKMDFDLTANDRLTHTEAFSRDGCDTILGWREPGPGSRQRFTVRYFYRDRILEEVELEPLFGEFWAHVQGKSVKPNEDYTRLTRTKPISKNTAKLRDTAKKMVVAWLATQLDTPVELRHPQFKDILNIMVLQDAHAVRRLKFLQLADGTQISPEEVNSSWAGPIAFVEYGRPLAELIPAGAKGVLLGSPILFDFLFDGRELINCTAHEDLVDTLQRARARFNQRAYFIETAPDTAFRSTYRRQPQEADISDLEVEVVCEDDPTPSTSPRYATVLYIHERRVLVEEAFNVPFGKISVRVRGGAVVPDVRTYDRLEAPIEDVATLIRHGAQDAMCAYINACHAAGDDGLQTLVHYLQLALTPQAVDVWPRVVATLRQLPIFELASGASCSYDDVTTLVARHKIVPWAARGEDITGMNAAEVVLAARRVGPLIVDFVHSFRDLPWRHVNAIREAYVPRTAPTAEAAVAPEVVVDPLETVFVDVRKTLAAIRTGDAEALVKAGEALRSHQGSGKNLVELDRGWTWVDLNHPVARSALAQGGQSASPFVVAAILTAFNRTKNTDDGARRLHLWVEAARALAE